MIVYNEKLKSFHLTGGRFSYVLYVNKAGFLQNVHYGARVQESDVAYLIGYRASAYAPDSEDKNCDMALNEMPSEYSSYGRGDYREPSLIALRRDGARMSRLRYASHKIFDGVPAVKGMPHARGGGSTLAVTLKDDCSALEIVLHYTVWEESGVLVRNVEIVNTGSEPLVLEKAFSFCCDLPEGEYSLLRLCGSWARERYPETAPLAHGVTRLQSLRGASSHQVNPFTALLQKGCSEESGVCYGVQLIYSESFALTAEKTPVGTVRLQGGIQDIGFLFSLGGGETFVTPQVMLTYSNEGTGGMLRSIHDFIRAQIVRPDCVYKRRPVLVNNWEATYFDFDNEKLFAIIDEAAQLGIDTFVLDDGWFGKRDDDRSGLGDWFVNQNKLKGGLQAVIDRCKQRGLKFGLWFEPEMISEDSDLYRAHPDWAVKKEGVKPVCGRNQLVLDFTRKEIVDYVFGVVGKVLRENDISYVKWDMNRNITEVYSAALPPEKQGEFMHRYILGVYDLAERLTAAFPNVFFEGCAGGGGRFDAGMLYYFPQIWTSDDTDAWERAKIQWGTSYAYPLSAMSCHVSVCPNHQTGRTISFETRGAVASLGATGYELDLSKMTKEDKEKTKAQIAAYKEIDELILKGDLYRLSDPFEGKYFCEMVVSKDKSRAYVVGERMLYMPCDYDVTLCLAGLDGEKTYRIRELNITASGAALCTVGLKFPRLLDFGSWTWHIEEVR